MRYHYKKPSVSKPKYGSIYYCDHPVYNRCTLFKINEKGLCIIQQRYDPDTKRTWWDNIDDWLTGELYLHEKFKPYFDERAKEPIDGIYPTVTIRQIMWALKIKPIPRERWKTCFDRKIFNSRYKHTPL